MCIKKFFNQKIVISDKKIHYFKCRITDDLLVGFFCDVDGDDKIRMDESELKYAEWVSPEDIVLQPYDYSLTNEMMRMFKEGNRVWN